MIEVYVLTAWFSFLVVLSMMNILLPNYSIKREIRLGKPTLSDTVVQICGIITMLVSIWLLSYIVTLL